MAIHISVRCTFSRILYYYAINIPVRCTKFLQLLFAKAAERRNIYSFDFQINTKVQRTEIFSGPFFQIHKYTWKIKN